MHFETKHHQHTAHCESGVLSTLLQYHQIDLNEAMVFGLASALSFVYFPFVKISGMPLISYRGLPRSILKNTCKQLGIKLVIKKFHDPFMGQQALNQAISQNHLVGIQTSVFWLPYFPPEMRFHFNAHNLLVYGKNDNNYLISDPVFEHPQQCAAEDLQKARFAKGSLAPKGLMYTVQINTPFDHTRINLAILPAIRKNAKAMLSPFPFVGCKGIHTLAKKIANLNQSKLPETKQVLFLAHIVRMQEEIGTGGAGFRYLYAAFLQESAQRLNLPTLAKAAETLTEIGDRWRTFASQAVKYCRHPQSEKMLTLATELHQIANDECQLWHDLSQLSD